MQIEYQLPKQKQPFFSVIKGMLRVFFKKVDTIYIGEKPQGPSLYVANHANKMGPINYELYFPDYTVKWAAYQMLSTYKMRWHYLRDILYIKKNKLNKVSASFKATFEAFFSQFFYKGMKFLPTYPDSRLRKTITKSVEILRNGSSIMIFPEDSSEGYYNFMKGFFAGFVVVAQKYYQEYGVDIPIYPVYYSKKKKLIVVGNKHYVQDYVQKGLNRKEIAEVFRNKVNELYTMLDNGTITR